MDPRPTVFLPCPNPCILPFLFFFWARAPREETALLLTEFFFLFLKAVSFFFLSSSLWRRGKTRTWAASDVSSQFSGRKKIKLQSGITRFLVSLLSFFFLASPSNDDVFSLEMEKEPLRKKNKKGKEGGREGHQDCQAGRSFVRTPLHLCYQQTFDSPCYCMMHSHIFHSKERGNRLSKKCLMPLFESENTYEYTIVSIQ